MGSIRRSLGEGGSLAVPVFEMTSRNTREDVMNAAVQLAERLDADPFAAAHWPPPVDEVVAARRIAMLDRGWSPAQDQPGHYIPSTPTDPRDFYRPPETWPTELLTDYLGILEQSADADSREAAEIREIVAKRQG